MCSQRLVVKCPSHRGRPGLTTAGHRLVPENSHTAQSGTAMCMRFPCWHMRLKQYTGVEAWDQTENKARRLDALRQSQDLGHIPNQEWLQGAYVKRPSFRKLPNTGMSPTKWTIWVVCRPDALLAAQPTVSYHWSQLKTLIIQWPNGSNQWPNGSNLS